MQVSVLGVLPFRQDGAERTFLITQLVPQIERGFQCHPCAPGIGAATFTKTAEGWRFDVGTPLVTEIGSYGKAPEPEIVQVGPERYAVVNEALRLQTYSDNSGACDPESGSDVPEDEREGGPGEPCWAYTSTLEFLPGQNPDYFDLKVTGTGPQEGQFAEETLYEVVDGAYQLTHKRTVDYRMVPHPVSGVELPRISLAEQPAVEQAVNEHLEMTAADMMCQSDMPSEDHEAEEDSYALEMYGFSYTLSPQGVVMQPVFPHVIVACAIPSTVPFERVLELASEEGILLRAAKAERQRHL